MSKTIAIVVKRGDAQANAALRTVSTLVSQVKCVIPTQSWPSEERLPKGFELVEQNAVENMADLILVLGGDGTLIHAANLLQNKLVPILGVNLGHIGFLTDVTRDELPELLSMALANTLPYVDRMRLDVEVYREQQCLSATRVLNDAVVSQLALARIARYRIAYGGQLVTTLRADGVIVSTPTGSTAYSMAAGGSILMPQLLGVAITPICPHALTQRPLVVAPDKEITVTLESNSDVMASFDGQSGLAIQPGDVLHIRRANIGVRLIGSPTRDYFQTLRTKLRWGDT